LSAGQINGHFGRRSSANPWGRPAKKNLTRRLNAGAGLSLEHFGGRSSPNPWGRPAKKNLTRRPNAGAGLSLEHFGGRSSPNPWGRPAKKNLTRRPNAGTGFVTRPFLLPLSSFFSYVYYVHFDLLQASRERCLYTGTATRAEGRATTQLHRRRRRRDV
ncbi:hypothetical protein B0H11DRAFT_2285642, partial [Mycena galericulata]